MAGRGRGRGKASFSFDVNRLGFGSGEALPKANVQPPPLYPPLQSKTTPLSATEVDEYLLALSQEYRGSIRDSQFYLKPKTIKRDIVRYTDRYKLNQNKTDGKCTWEPDWNFVPKELRPVKKRKPGKIKGNKVNVSSAVKSEPAEGETSNDIDVVKKLESLEKIASKVDLKGEEGEHEEENEEFDEEEFEDDNDYNFDYYDDGGDKYGDDDDGEQGPVY